MDIKNKLKLFLKIVEWIVFSILLIALFLVASPLLPTKEYISTHLVISGSMEPAITKGSIVFSSLHNTNLSKGDIIVFKSPQDEEITIVHRIIDIKYGNYITKGDNNDNNDDWEVFPTSVKGKVLLTIPYIGYAVNWMKTVQGFITVLVFPALFIIFSQIQKIKEGISEEVERRTNVEVRKRLSKETPPPVIPVVILLSLFLCSSKVSDVYALFSSSAEIKGMTISIPEVSKTVILNEVMWMGSTISEKDEWIELKNMTDHEIDISNWRIEGAVTGKNGHLEIPNGYSIPADGYFLIANKYDESEESALITDVDLRSTNINLNDEYDKNGVLILKDKDSNEIDSIGVMGEWPAGINDNTKHSMQRSSDPENGWYSCTDTNCTSTIYWYTGNTMNYGTPGSENI